MESKPKQPKPMVTLSIGIVIIVVLVILGFIIYRQEGDNRTTWLTVGADQATADRLDVTAAVQSVDPIKGEVVVRLAFAAQGTLAGSDGRSASQDVTIETNSSSKPEIKFKKGQPFSSVDVVVELYNGLYTDYPYDSHEGELQIYATAAAPSETEGEKTTEETIPVSVELSGFVHGFNVQGSAGKDVSPTYADIDLEISRSASTLVWATFVMILLWLMALGVAGVTYFMVSSQRKFEFGSFAWMGGLLFAFISFRSAAPGAPPLGSMIDFVSFYWAEFIVSVCLIIMVCVYLIRQPK